MMDTQAIVEDLLAVVPEQIGDFDGLSGVSEADLKLWLPTVPTSKRLIAIIENEISRLAAVALARRAGVAVADNETRTRALEMWLEGRGVPPKRPSLCAQLLAKGVIETGLQGSASPDVAYGFSKSLAPETERVARAVARYHLDRCGSPSDRVSQLQQVMNKQLLAKLRQALQQVSSDGDVDCVLEQISFGTIGSLVKALLVRGSRAGESTADDEDVHITETTAMLQTIASLRNHVCHGTATSEQGHQFCQLVSSCLGMWLRCRIIPRGALIIEVKWGQFGIIATAEDEHGVCVELIGVLAPAMLSAGDSLLIEPNPSQVRLKGEGLRRLPKKGAWCNPANDVAFDPIDLC